MATSPQRTAHAGADQPRPARSGGRSPAPWHRPECGSPGWSITANPKQPLAFNDLLVTAARHHSVWQIDNDIFSHIGVGAARPATEWPLRATPLQARGLGREHRLARRRARARSTRRRRSPSSTNSLFLSAGHRTNLLNDGMREIGVGQAIVASFARHELVSLHRHAGSCVCWISAVPDWRRLSGQQRDARYGLGKTGNWSEAGPRGTSDRSPKPTVTAVTSRPSASERTGSVSWVRRRSWSMSRSPIRTSSSTWRAPVRSSTSLTLIGGATGAELLGIASTAIEGSASPRGWSATQGTIGWPGGGRRRHARRPGGADSLAGGVATTCLPAAADSIRQCSRRAQRLHHLARARWPHCRCLRCSRGDGLTSSPAIEQTSFAGCDQRPGADQQHPGVHRVL